MWHTHKHGQVCHAHKSSYYNSEWKPTFKKSLTTSSFINNYPIEASNTTNITYFVVAIKSRCYNPFFNNLFH